MSAELKLEAYEWTPVIKCAVESCTNLYDRYNLNPSIKFFDFPHHKQIAMLWKDICKVPHHHTTENLKVCSNHFNNNDYFNERLKPNAIPHCNLTVFNFDEEMEQAVDENYLLKSQLELLQKEKNELQSQIEKIDMKLKKKTNLLQQLKLRCEYIKKKCSQTQHKRNLLTKVFSQAQIGVLMKKKKIIWSDDDLAMAFTLRHMGGKDCYLYLKHTLNMPLPALLCVQKWAASLHET